MPITPVPLPVVAAGIAPLPTLPDVLAPPPVPPVVAASTSEDAAHKPDERALHEAVSLLNDGMRAWSTHLKFELDSDAGRVIIQVVDAQTGDVIRQVPSEEAIHMSRVVGRLKDLAFHAEA